MSEPHEGFKVFVVNAGRVNDEGRRARTSTRALVHMGTGGAGRFTVREHTLEFDLVAPDGHEVHVQGMADTGLAGSICDRGIASKNDNPADDVGRTFVFAPRSRCPLVTPYEIWTMHLNVGAAEVVFSPAVFDPITAINPDAAPVAVPLGSVFPKLKTARGCHREGYHGPVYWRNATGPRRFRDHGFPQFVSRHRSIGIAMNEDQTQMKARSTHCARSLGPSN